MPSSVAFPQGAVVGFPPGALHHSPAAAPPDGGASTSAAAPATATTVRVFGLGLPESLGVLFIKKNLATTRPETLRKQLLHDLKEVIELVYPHGFLFLVGGAPLYAAQEKKLSSILVLLHPPDNVLHLRSDPLGVASAQQHLLAQQQFTAHLQAGVFGGTLDDPTVPLPAGAALAPLPPPPPIASSSIHTPTGGGAAAGAAAAAAAVAAAVAAGGGGGSAYCLACRGKHRAHTCGKPLRNSAGSAQPAAAAAAARAAAGTPSAGLPEVWALATDDTSMAASAAAFEGSHGAMAAAIELPAAHETAGGAHDGGAPDDLDSDAVAELHAQEVLAADGAHDSAQAHAPSWAPSATSAGAVWALKKRGRPAFEDAHDGASVKSNKSVQELD
jgi:hypothetical protein